MGRCCGTQLGPVTAALKPQQCRGKALPGAAYIPYVRRRVHLHTSPCWLPQSMQQHLLSTSSSVHSTIYGTVRLQPPAGVTYVYMFFKFLPETLEQLFTGWLAVQYAVLHGKPL